MKPGRFVGIAWNSGDELCYKIATETRGLRSTILTRSIVTPRFDGESAHGAYLRRPSDYFFPRELALPEPELPNGDTVSPVEGSGSTSQDNIVSTERSVKRSKNALGDVSSSEGVTKSNPPDTSSDSRGDTSGELISTPSPNDVTAKEWENLS